MMIDAIKMDQLCIPDYILENRPPTLTEICQQITPITVKLPRTHYCNPLKRKIKYPSNWKEVSRLYKEQVSYRCQVCHKQCLRPEDSKIGLSKSEVAQRTLNAHHINGNTFDDRPENIFVVCQQHHLEIHRGTGGVPPKGQGYLFET